MDSLIQIPGHMEARVENGRITGYVFNIAANDAGYFGEEIFNIEGDELTSEEFFAMVSDTIMTSYDKRSGFITVELGS